MKMLSFGATGPEVRLLQALLNVRPPSALPPLQVDGIFGSKTLARVKEFQQKNGLQVDGIVGPQTSAALRTIPKPSDRLAFLCGNGDPANRGIAASIRQAVLAPGGPQGPSPTQSQGFLPASGTGAFPSILGFRRLAPLTPPQEATATGVYGASLDFTRIRITDARSPTGRPFTMSSFQLVGPTLQIMVLGTFSPSPELLIHELAHVWQSQHHMQADAFESNCLASQGQAAAKNLPFAADPTVSSHPEWPSDFPFSAYAHEPGKAFGEYAGEQIAQQIEKGELPIIAHVKSVGRGAVDPGNVKSLELARVENRLNPLVKI